LATSTRPARGAEQAGNTEGRVGAQFERIAEVVVQAAQDGVHPLQARHRLQVDGVAHRQILTLDQRKAQVAGQVGVLEIGFVVRPRGEQHGQRRLAVDGA
jgi:hypothetical protein